jgi:anaphase-promoting complex subunit 6
MTLQETVRALERRVDESLQNNPADALLPSELLLTLRPNSPPHMHLRAQVLVAAREYDSGLFFLRTNAMDRDERGAALAMTCCLELGDTKQCMVYAERVAQSHDSACVVKALCLLGRCAFAHNDVAKSSAYFRRALAIDPACSSALSSIVEGNLMPQREQARLIDELALPPELEVLRSTYRAMVGLDTAADAPIPHSMELLRRAHGEHARNDLRESALLTAELLRKAPYCKAAVCLHLSTLVDLKATARLFELAQSLCDSARGPLAMYAIGCYYFCLVNFEKAGRYFSRVMELEPSFAEAAVAYGHCYARLEEGEQALSVYRRALNLFPYLHCCATFIGMQYSRVHSWTLAMCFLEEARSMEAADPLVLNEMGVLFMRTGRLDKALSFFQQARACLGLETGRSVSEYLDCILFNLGTVYRKRQEFDQAIEFYTLYANGRPSSSHAHCALGFTYHLSGNIKAAIPHYHAALSLKSDAFCRDMLERALGTEMSRNVGGPAWGDSVQVAYSPSPSDVTFATISRVGRSESTQRDLSMPSSSHRSVGRSLFQ